MNTDHLLVPISDHLDTNFSLTDTRDQLTSVLLSLMDEAGVKNVSWAEMTPKMQDVLNFDKELAFGMANSTADEGAVRLSTWQSLVPSIQWKQFIQTISLGDIQLYLDTNPVILIEREAYFKALDQLLSSTNCKTINNYIMISIIMQYLPIVYPDPLPTSKTCVEDIRDSTLKQASGAMFARKHMDNETIQEAATLVSFLFVAVFETLQKASWMDSLTREKALEKARAMNVTIGAPDMSYDDQLLDMYYQGLTFQDTDSYVKLIQTLNQWEASLVFNSIFQFNAYYDHELLDVWIDSPDYVGAGHYVDFNTIAIVGGLLQPPLFHKDYPKSVNFGVIGFAIGHEITHGFDSDGRHFDKNGNLFDWWDNETSALFDQKSLCLKEQYSNISVGPNLTLDGVKTLGENIADNGGIKQGLLVQ